jgi:hypothetical protein
MPNWCANTAEISGPASVIHKLDVGAREGALFASLHPMPAELEETTSPGDTPNWYDWCVSNWGTKWDTSAEASVVEPDDNGEAVISLVFDSAWGPPVEWYEYITEEYGVVVRASYYEPGMAFVGVWSDDGCMHYDYSEHDSTTVREHIGDDLDDQWCISESLADWEEEENLDIDLDSELSKINEQEKFQ